MTHELPKLPYDLKALEPNYLGSTMEFHYGKHHQTYVTNLNNALAGTGFENLAIEELMTRVNEIAQEKRQPVINNGGGHYNHSLFWQIMGPNAGGEPTGKVAEQITAKWGDYAAFKKEFTNAGLTQFGSGWAWLTVNPDGTLNIEKSANQDNCLMNSNRKPILTADVWEHAYYLEHQNKRADWMETFYKLVNWAQVEKNYANALSGKTIVDTKQLATV